MAKARSRQIDTPTLADLVAGVARIAANDARALQAAAEALSDSEPPDADREAVIAGLQESFHVLTQCVLSIRDKTDHLKRLSGTDSRAGGPDPGSVPDRQ